MYVPVFIYYFSELESDDDQNRQVVGFYDLVHASAVTLFVYNI